MYLPIVITLLVTTLPTIALPVTGLPVITPPIVVVATDASWGALWSEEHLQNYI